MARRQEDGMKKPSSGQTLVKAKTAAPRWFPSSEWARHSWQTEQVGLPGSADTFFEFPLAICMCSVDPSHTLKTPKDHIFFLFRFPENTASDNSPGIYAQATQQLAWSWAYNRLSELHISPNPQGCLSVFNEYLKYGLDEWEGTRFPSLVYTSRPGPQCSSSPVRYFVRLSVPFLQFDSYSLYSLCWGPCKGLPCQLLPEDLDQWEMRMAIKC